MSGTYLRIREPKADAPGARIFWGELAPCDHLVQIYRDERGFIDALEGFVAGGLRSNDGVIVIATAAHRKALEERLLLQQVELTAARAEDRYLAVDAEQTLDRFMVGSWPDEDRFGAVVLELLARARGANGRPVRAFGEMVALLWARGDSGATVRLEHLWQELCRTQAFCLFCAYPRIGFTRDAADALRDLCAAHSRVIDR